MQEELGFRVHLNSSYEEALEKVRAALKTEGFGVLTHIDVKATLKEKLGEDFKNYAILGACNPPLAHRALSHDSLAGLMLPCNVTVEDWPEGGVQVTIANPRTMLQVGAFANDPTLCAIADEAYQRLARAAKALEA
jgi:uncharacterized protein (DUF302 family)